MKKISDIVFSFILCIIFSTGLLAQSKNKFKTDTIITGRFEQIQDKASELNQASLQDYNKKEIDSLASLLALKKNLTVKQVEQKFAPEILYPIDSTVASIYIKTFNNKSDPVREALDADDDSVKSFDYTSKNKTLSNLAVLFNSGKIDGFRIYLAKEGEDYGLIIVGTLQGKDQIKPIEISGKSYSPLQNYSNPCKPTCGGEKF